MIHPGYEVIDPDGFDRTDDRLYSRLFTLEEYESGAASSTCRFKPGFSFAAKEL